MTSTPMASSPSADASAANRVFDVPELLENILLKLLEHSDRPWEAASNARAAKTVLLSQRVSKTFHATTNGSINLLRELWLLPDKPPRNSAVQHINPLFFQKSKTSLTLRSTPFAYGKTYTYSNTGDLEEDLGVENSSEHSWMRHTFGIKLLDLNGFMTGAGGQSWRRMLPFCPTGLEHSYEVNVYCKTDNPECFGFSTGIPRHQITLSLCGELVDGAAMGELMEWVWECVTEDMLKEEGLPPKSTPVPQ